MDKAWGWFPALYNDLGGQEIASWALAAGTGDPQKIPIYQPSAAKPEITAQHKQETCWRGFSSFAIVCD